MDLMKTNPALAAESATKLARKKVNQDVELGEADNSTKGLVAFLGTTVFMGLAGWWTGGMKAKRDALIADWEAEGAQSVGASLAQAEYPWDHERGVKDPTTMWYMPKLIVFPLVSGVLALISASMRKGRAAPSGFERTMTMTAGSTFGLMVANMIGSRSYKAKEKKLEKATDLNSVKAQTTNGAMAG